MKIASEDIYKTWPEPFQKLLSSFAQYPYDPVVAMYMPACLCILQTIMQGSFKTVRGRGPNTNDDTLSKTGGGKDDNATEAIILIRTELSKAIGGELNIAHNANLLSMFTPISLSVTGVTQFLEVLQPRHVTNNGAPIIDTEGEDHYLNIGQKGGASLPSRQIVELEIGCFNGVSVKARKTKDSDIENLNDPNFSFHRMTQNEPFFRAANGWFSTKGYLPRKSFWLDDENREDLPSTERNAHFPDPDPDFIPFLIYAGEWFFKKLEKGVIYVDSCHKGGAVNKFEVDYIFGELKHELSDGDFRVVGKRVAQLAEKYVTMLAAWAWCWKDYCREKKLDGSDKFEPVEKIVRGKSGITLSRIDGSMYEECIIPLMKYFIENKLWILERIGEGSDDRLYELMFSAYERAMKSKAEKYAPWLKVHIVPRELFKKKCTECKELKGIINDGNDSIDVALNKWINSNGFTTVPIEIDMEDESKSLPCVVTKKYARDSELVV